MTRTPPTPPIRLSGAALAGCSGALLGVLVLVLAGCRGDGGTAAPASTTDPEQLSGEVIVLAASSLTEAFEAIGAKFEAAHPGVSVRFSFASSSTLAAQAVAGAPADVFAAADTTTMRRVTEAGFAATQPRVFARNALVIAVPAGNPAGVEGPADLAEESLTLAVCAVEVPCGAAAQRAFALVGVDPRPDTYEEDVKATLGKVALGEVDAGLVYRSDVRAAAGAVEAIPFPAVARVSNDYPITVLAQAPNPSAARAFVAGVRSAAGLAVLIDAGFRPP